MATVFDPIEQAPTSDLRSLQLQRLQDSLQRAYGGNHRYREKFEQTGVRPSDLHTLEDLRRFPFTVKDDLRAAYPFDFFAVPQDQIARIHASSGTTGQSTVVGYTKADIATWSDVVARSIFAAGGRSGMKVHVSYGYGLFTGGLGAHYGAERLGCTVIPVSGGQTERQVHLICDFKPDIIMVTPSYMLALLDEFKRQDRDPRESSLKIGIFGAEPWTEGMRTEIETAFDMKALDIYGLSEIIGPGVAQECCDAPGALTIWEDHFYPEIIDPESGALLPEGETGELVLTSLTKQAMPIIRYRTKDLTCLMPGEGRSMRRLARIRARADDMLIVRGVNVYPAQIEDQILKSPQLSAHYLIEITRPERLDYVTLFVEGREGTTDDDHAVAAMNLKSGVKDVLGVSVEVVVQPPGTIARSQGKAKRVIDRRDR